MVIMITGKIAEENCFYPLRVIWRIWQLELSNMFLQFGKSEIKKLGDCDDMCKIRVYQSILRVSPTF